MEIRNELGGGLEGCCQWIQNDTECTYVKDMEDPLQVLLASSDRVALGVCIEQLRKRVPPTVFDDYLLDPRHSSAIEILVSLPPSHIMQLD